MKCWIVFKLYKIQSLIYLIKNTVMKYSKVCECCWNVVSAYTHNLNCQMVEMLWKLIQFRQEQWRPAKLGELWFRPVEYANFQKLRYFKLIYSTEDGREASPKWILFRTWKIQCENRSASFWNHALPLDHEAWATDKKWRKKVWIWEINSEYERKKEKEYKVEKPQMKTLFSIE